MSQELLPCPFCGGKASIEQNARNGYKLKCTSCVVGITQKTIHQSMEWLKDRMIEDWNKRVPQSTGQREGELAAFLEWSFDYRLDPQQKQDIWRHKDVVNNYNRRPIIEPGYTTVQLAKLFLTGRYDATQSTPLQPSGGREEDHDIEVIGEVIQLLGFTPTNKNHLTIEVFGMENYIGNHIKKGAEVRIILRQT